MSTKEIYLIPFETPHIQHLHKWLNDEQAMRMVGRTPLTYEEVVQEVEKKRMNDDLILGIETNEQVLAGWVFLKDIDYAHGRASIGILLSSAARGQGYGQIAMEQMIDLGFKQLRLNKIYLTTRGLNEQAIALYKKIGFVTEGILRNHAYVEGKYVDTYFMGILASEWNR
ncbi:GNAT family N-acetyltransferase (plasmid) [Priestia megaterium]|uniref:GNAT family N-acetyltransferase n=1 Tax=Priestia megaterium TaxID=1404 RepID=UPI001EDC5850|nr:GNAT family protein [Priestia megaterium]UKJ83445.1 GNAT family N-acetyltransferase [Priestia megaterium]